MSFTLTDQARPTPHPDRRWLRSYPPGVPAEIEFDPNGTLIDILEDGFRRYAQRINCVFLGKSFLFREIDSMSMNLGAWLQSTRLPAGTRVALMMPNTPQYMVALAAVLRAGYVVVNINPLYTARELQQQLADSGAEIIVVLENFGAVLEKVIDRTSIRHVLLTAMGDLLAPGKRFLVNAVLRHVRNMVPEFKLPTASGRTVTRYRKALDEGERLKLRRPPIDGNALAFLQYTGGTTGVSKGAMLLHRNVAANVLQFEAWMEPTLGPRRGETLVTLCALPLYHIYALTVCYFIGIRLGQCVLLVPNARDIPALVKTLEKHPVHIFPAVNTLFNALLEHPAFRRLDHSRILICAGGGMSVQPSTAERWKSLTGRPIVEGYGLSETSPVATSNRLDIDTFSGSIGLPISSTSIEIRGERNEPLPPGIPGEICIRGPQVMAGYWNRPEDTDQVMTSDGFLRSGDIATMDEAGYIRIVDRKKDMILVSGFNVFPNEIEQVVSMHPDVLECAAIGVPDARSGEAVKVFVVKRIESLDEETLIRHCKENLTAYKRPKHLEFREELPKTNVGKVLRRELRNTHSLSAEQNHERAEPE